MPRPSTQPKVIAVIHSHAHNDGGQPILDLLATKYDLLTDADAARTRYRLIAQKSAAIKRPLVIEAEYPQHLSELLAKHDLDRSDVTDVLMIVDAGAMQYDPNGVALKMIANASGVTGIALGNVHLFDPPAEGIGLPGMLPERTKRLVAFIGRVIGVPVVYLATGETVIDNEAIMRKVRREINNATRLNREITNDKPLRVRKGVIKPRETAARS